MNPRIELNPRVCAGKPIIRGTRIPVSLILEQLQHDQSSSAILRGYPELQEEDIRAALEFARFSIEHSQFETAAS